jgi:sigma-B regulation protein RsbU (phosphoserine phosphatase)
MTQLFASSSHAGLPAHVSEAVCGTFGQRILVVEDSDSERVWLEETLRKSGFEVASAANGFEALSLMATFSAHLVVSDWRMPGLDGVELCQRLRDVGSAAYVYFILLTGQDSDNDIVSGLDAGADDYMSKPVNSSELAARIRAGLRIVALKKSLEQRNRCLETTLRNEAESHRKIRNDLSTAADMQRDLLPRESDLPPEIEMGTLFEPAQGVGGDIFGCFSLSERHLAFYLADVCGHGIPAAMMSLTVHKALQQAAGKIPATHLSRHDSECAPPFRPVDEVVGELNSGFYLERNPTRHFALVYGVLDHHSGEGWLCQAGIPHPLKSDRRGCLQSLGRGGFPVGLLDTASFEIEKFRLRDGERLFLYSDGIVDCRNREDNSFGHARLSALLRESHRSPLPTVCARLRRRLTRWRESTAPSDDVSLLAIGRRSMYRRSRVRSTRSYL